MKCKFFLFTGLFAILTCSCTKKQLEAPDCFNEISYAMDIKPITDNTCALVGCHEAGFITGDYTTYAGFREKVDSGILEVRAIQIRDMPPSNTLGPKELTEAQIELIRCWIMQGAPNN